MSDNFLAGIYYVLSRQFDRGRRRISGVKRVRERRSSPRSAVRHRNGLNPAAKNRVRLFQPVDRRIQFRDHRVGFLGKDNQLDVDFLIAHTSTFP